MKGKIKIYLLDEAHKLSSDAQNSVLKLLEDTPKHVRFILCTTDPEKLIKTIRTRCTSFATVGLQRNKIVMLLKKVCDGEGVKFSDDILAKIAETSEGSARQALVIMDQVIDLPTDEAAMEAIQKIGVNENTIMELSQALLKPATKWETLGKIIKGLDEEPEKIRYAVLGYMATVLLNADNPRAAQIIQIFSDSWMYIGKSGLVSSCYLVTKI
jgi:DNA polymerase III gamma/tau subunit